MANVRRGLRTAKGSVAAALAIVCAACGGGDTTDAAPAGAGDTMPSETRASVAALPSAILGQAPPPRGEAVRYLPGDTSTVGYLSVPAGPGPFPAVILVHEWNGLVDRVRQVADALADEGYVALAADLYHGRVGTDPDENMALVQAAQADMDGVIANLDGAQAFLRARPDVTGRIGSMGWCFGGGIALSYGLGGADHDATAIFYGRLVDDPDVLARLDHEVYGTFAALDRGPSPESVAAFESALREAGIENDLHVYDAVNHGFWLRVDEDPEVRAAPAADAWRRLKDYLKRTLD